MSYAIVSMSQSISLAYIVHSILSTAQHGIVMTLFLWLYSLVLLGFAMKAFQVYSKLSLNRLIVQKNMSVSYDRRNTQTHSRGRRGQRSTPSTPSAPLSDRQMLLPRSLSQPSPLPTFPPRQRGSSERLPKHNEPGYFDKLRVSNPSGAD